MELTGKQARISGVENLKFIMNSMIRTLIFCLLASSGVMAQTPAQTVPAFEFYKFDKSLFTNKDLPANKPLFFFFFDCTCDHCQQAMKYLNQHFNDFKKTGVYLISLDTQQAMVTFLNKYAPDVINQKNVTVLQDTKTEFIARFKPRKYPSLFLYDSNRKLLVYEDNPDNMFRFSKQLNTAGK